MRIFIKLFRMIKPILFKVRYGRRFQFELEQRKWESQMTVVISKNGAVYIGKNANFRQQLQLRSVYDGVITMGRHVFCNTNVSITAMKCVKIGNNVRIANNVVIVDHDHDYQGDIATFQCSEVVIEDNVWIGANSVILRGVHIGKNAVIAAGSVVNKNVQPFSVVGGAPAKTLKMIKELDVTHNE